MTLQSRIAAAADELRRSGGEPHQVHLTKTDAAQLQYELMAEGGQVSTASMRNGLQKAVQSILGLQIVWRSPSFHVV